MRFLTRLCLYYFPKDHIPAAILIFMACFYLSYEYLFLGADSYFRLHDSADAAIPCYMTITNHWRDQGLFKWLPGPGSGIDLLSFCTHLLSFQVIIFRIFKGLLAYQVILVTQLFMAGYYTYRLCREKLSLDKTPSILAGIFCSFNFYQHEGDTPGYLMGFATLPFVLISLENYFKARPKGPLWPIFIFGLIFSILFYNVALSLPFAMVAMVLWYLFVRNLMGRRLAAILAVFFFGCILAHYQTFISFAINARNSHRLLWPVEGIDWKVFWSEFHESVQLDQEKIFIPMALYALGHALLKRTSRPFLFILVSCLLTTKYSQYVLNTSLKLLLSQLNINLSFNFSRFSYFNPLLRSIIIAYFFQAIPVKMTIFKSKSLSLPIRIFGILALVVHLGRVNYEQKLKHVMVGHFNYIFNNNLLQRFAQATENERMRAPFRIEPIIKNFNSQGDIQPTVLQVYGLEAAGGYLNLYPRHYKELWQEIMRPFFSSSKGNSRKKYFHDWGHRVYLFNNDDTKINFKENYNLKLLSLLNVKYFISNLPIEEDENLRPVSHESFKSITSSDAYYLRPYLFQPIKIYTEDVIDLYIYENLQSFPRFYLATDLKIFANNGELLDGLAKETIENLRKNAFVTEQVYNDMGRPDQLTVNQGHIELKKYLNDTIELAVETDGSAVLVVANNHSPYWTCKINGRPEKIHRINQSLWGVLLREKGKLTLVFEYSPPY